MSCGSCSAFAAIATVETCMRRAGTPLKDLDLSEQQIVDCGYNGKDMNGCNGAQLGAYQKFLAFSGKNVSHEVQYPYLDRDPNLECVGKLTWNTGAKVTKAITDYGCSEDKLKKLGKYLCSKFLSVQILFWNLNSYLESQLKFYICKSLHKKVKYLKKMKIYIPKIELEF